MILTWIAINGNKLLKCLIISYILFIDFITIPEDIDFPWKELMPVLNTSAYENPLVLEVCMPAGDKPEEYLKRAFAAGQRLYRM